MRPFMFKEKITDITVEELRAVGVRGILLDVDNTLTTHDSQEIAPAVMAWLQGMTESGFSLMIVSNGKRRRVTPFAEKVGLPFVSMAAKPLPFGFLRAVKALGFKRRECVEIGDQYFTDFLGGKLAGVRVIQLMPIQLEYHKPFMMFKRKAEKLLMKNWQTEG